MFSSFKTNYFIFLFAIILYRIVFRTKAVGEISAWLDNRKGAKFQLLNLSDTDGISTLIKPSNKYNK